MGPGYLGNLMMGTWAVGGLRTLFRQLVGFKILHEDGKIIQSLEVGSSLQRTPSPLTATAAFGGFQALTPV